MRRRLLRGEEIGGSSGRHINAIDIDITAVDGPRLRSFLSASTIVNTASISFICIITVYEIIYRTRYSDHSQYCKKQKTVTPHYEY